MKKSRVAKQVNVPINNRIADIYDNVDGIIYTVAPYGATIINKINILSRMLHRTIIFTIENVGKHI